MGKLLNIIPMSDLRQDAAKIMKQLQNIKEPLVITQRGRVTAVIISVEAYGLDAVLGEADSFLAEEPS